MTQLMCAVGKCAGPHCVLSAGTRLLADLAMPCTPDADPWCGNGGHNKPTWLRGHLWELRRERNVNSWEGELRKSRSAAAPRWA